MSSYDHYVTVECPAAWDSGWQQGLIAEYLDEFFREEPQYDGNAESHFEMGLAQGKKERDSYTAEELLIMAWEFWNDGPLVGYAQTMASIRGSGTSPF